MATTFFRLSPTSSFLSPAQFTKPVYFRNSKINNPITRIRCSHGSNSPPQPPGTECPVPPEQQPVNEYNSLSTSFPFSSAAGEAVEFYSRLFVTGAAFALFVGLPVAWFGAPGADLEPLRRILAGATSGVLVVTIIVVRMYLGWAYVGNRLLSATVEYEETGWYDGQIWVKTPEILARDRLLGSFSTLPGSLLEAVSVIALSLCLPWLVKPVLSRLKYTLISLAVILVVSARLLLNLEGGQTGLYVKGGSEGGDRSVPGVYSDESARSFEPDAFCGEPALSQ